MSGPLWRVDALGGAVPVWALVFAPGPEEAWQEASRDLTVSRVVRVRRAKGRERPGRKLAHRAPLWWQPG